MIVVPNKVPVDATAVIIIKEKALLTRGVRGDTGVKNLYNQII
jgi:energy-converting hydrogenase Eha subunit H